jgi:hypothetical protein
LRFLTVVTFIFIGLAASSGSNAGAFEIDPGMRSRPGTDGVPTVVALECFVIDIEEINDHEQSFVADISIRMQWQDPRLARPGRSDVVSLQLTDIWNPRLRIANQRDVKEHFPDIVRIDSDGSVAFEQRYSGEFTSLADISRFPFDERTFRIIFVTADQSGKDIRFDFSDSNFVLVTFLA